MRSGYSLMLLLALGTGGAVVAQSQATPEAPAAEAAKPVSAEEARTTALSFADQLESNYVFPDIARKYADTLRAKANAGGYDAAGSAASLALALTADVQAVSPDNHLRVLTGGEGGPGPRRLVRVAPGSPQAAGTRPAPGPRPLNVQPIEEARWLAPGIAYIRFTAFPGDPAVTEATARFMAEHADAKTLIFDIRTHRGGGLDQMDAMLPYLFAKPTVLVTMDTRGSVARNQGEPLGDSGTLRPVPVDQDVVRREHVVIPLASEKRLRDAKVILLTSGFSASAAEHFALSMKRTGRATLIGETTAGAGNYGGVRPIGSGLAAFIPVGRTFDPDTGEGWEGTGVAPHVQVAAERALIEALVRSGIAPAEAERLSAEVQPSGPMRRIRPAG